MKAAVAQQKLVASGYAVSGFEKIIGVLAAVLLAIPITAVFRGQSYWADMPAFVWAHITTVAVALLITPAMMWRRRGDRLHRRLGYVWSAAMLTTAVVSLGIRNETGGFSFIHLFSVITLIGVPALICHARSKNITRHRSTVHGLVLGALLIAGFFTLPGNRLIGNMLFG